MVSEFLTVQQVADKLQAHIMSVYKLIQSGRLKAMRIPGVGLRIETRELEKFLDQNIRKPRASRRRRVNVEPRK